MSGSKSKYDSKHREMVQCQICKLWYHRLDVHLKSHKYTVSKYRSKYPGWPTISETASSKAREAAKVSMEQRMGKKSSSKSTKDVPSPKSDKLPFMVGVARLYERDDLAEGECEFVPNHDPHWMPGKRELEEWELLAIGIQDNLPVYLHGPTGCGKSAGVMELAAILNQPLTRVQMTQQFKESTMIGKTDLVVDESTGLQVTQWTDGLLPAAMRRGWWLLVDEITATPPGIMFAVQAVLEGNPLVLPTGEVVKPHKHFRIVATDNTNGRGDESGLYAGTHVMNEATLDRFGVVIVCDYPLADDEIRIITSKGGVSGKTARSMVAVARKVRDAFANESCFCTFSTRRLIAWARLTTRLNGDVRKASRPSIINKLSSDDSKFVDGLIQRHFGGNV